MFAEKDQVKVVQHLLSIESPTMLVKELAEGDFRRNKTMLTRLKELCDLDTHDAQRRLELVTLLLELFGRESFLESTQQESVNVILEAVLATKLINVKRDAPNCLGTAMAYITSPAAQSNLARLLKAFLDRFPELCITNLARLMVLVAPLTSVSTCDRSLVDVCSRYNVMLTHFITTHEVPEPVLFKVVPKPQTQQARPLMYVQPGDPPVDEYAVRLGAIPTPDELMRLDEELKVRTNPILAGLPSGSVKEYVDTQWRLLRSDALANIRIGLQSVKEAKRAYAKKIATMRPGPQGFPAFQFPRHDSFYAYKDVVVCGFADKRLGGVNALSYIMSFVACSRGSRPIDWAVSRRLIPGSLVVLSNDGFETLIWGTVGARNDSLLSSGKTSIEINADQMHLIDSMASYEMLETRALWTSYHPVLDRLVTFFNHPEKFPLPELLIAQRADNNAHVFPGTWYLKDITKDGVASYKLEPYLNWDDARLRAAVEAQRGGPIPPAVVVQPNQAANPGGLFDGLLNGFRDWNPFGAAPAPVQPIAAATMAPAIDVDALVAADAAEAKARLAALEDPLYPRDLTILDPSQWEAMKMILTKRLSIVQGPPGTGKTFIGLKATQILLDQRGFAGPILCVCYTNHALDQFLEGILKFEKSIVRVGGRCKSEILAEYSLQKLRPRTMGSRLVYGDLNARESLREQIQTLVKALNRPALLLDQFWDFIDFKPSNPDIQGRLTALYQMLGGTSQLNQQKASQTASTSAPAPPAPKKAAGANDDAAANVGADDDYDTDSEASSDDELEELLRANDLDLSSDEEENDNHGRARSSRKDKEAKTKPSETKLFVDIHGTHAALLRLCAGGTEDLRYLDHQYLPHNYQQFMGLAENVRKSIFLTWLQETTRILRRECANLTAKFAEAVKRINAFNDGTTVDFLAKQRVIGMTTTGAAKNAAILQALNPKVIIVEEAAEIFEAHVIACLTATVEKVILIGDHQQLRPKVVHFPLTKRGLDISLFERLIMAGIPHVALRQQHRMHPEISRYLRPIYPHLFDGPNTSEKRLDYANLGFERRVTFLNHNWKEFGSGEDDEAGSKSNVPEAEYIFGLARYLLAQGVPPANITVIAMYQGQNRQLKSFFRGSQPKGFGDLELIKKQLKEVRICCVDDYQGEENEIIIVSLVRCNQDGTAGFVRIPNRVCVALSRARSMMFVLGSQDTLLKDAKRKKSKAGREEPPIWPPTLELMQNTGVVANQMTISCPIHKDDAKSVKQMAAPSDWQQSLTACSKPCAEQLDCGHWCKQKCHGRMAHGRCYEPCERVFDECGHRCPKPCFQSCDECTVAVKRRLPCGHEMEVPCSKNQDPSFQPSCPAPCPRLLACGHQCDKKCGQRCGDCYVLIEEAISTCGHKIQSVPCHTARNPVKLAKQPHSCTTKLDCGHNCPGKCNICSQTGHHAICQSKCDKPRPCSHVCRGQCKEPHCPPCPEKCPMRCAHGPCKHECGKRCNPCMDRCKWRCKHLACTQICSDMCDRVGCNEPCELKMPCGHPCVGLCGETCPNVCRDCSPDTKVFCSGYYEDDIGADKDSRYIRLTNCGHLVEVNAMDKVFQNKQEDGLVALPRCPLCSSVISDSFGRYSNDIKYQLKKLEDIRAMYRKDAIRRKFAEGNHRAAISMIQALFKARPLGHSMNPSPRDISMLLLLALAYLKTGKDESDVEPLINEVLRREPDNKEAKALQDSLLSKVLPQVVQALQGEVQKGAWYMCRNGHPYAIGECGGAMQQSRCPCGAPIGGGSHALLADNRHFGAADGSRFPAWGEAANMANFRFEDHMDD
jgi:hypothetical protein